MYKQIIRPILFLINPETVHHLVVMLVRLIALIPGLPFLLRSHFTIRHPLLETRIGGLTFVNKVILAAGFDKNADFYRQFSIFGFAGIEVGTVTPLPQRGNPKPRSFRLPQDSALINRMGFNNKGVSHTVEKLTGPKPESLIIGGNIGKNTVTPNEKAADDYGFCFKKLYDHVDYLVINVSCPNIKDLDKLQDHESLREILDRVMLIRASKPFRKPVFLKISPDLSFEQIDEIIELYHAVGLDGIIATNTTTGRDNLLTPAQLVETIGQGGLSGAPLKNKSLDTIRYICKQSDNKIPVIGVGGIINAQDAIDMIEAGAVMLQVYTGFIYEGPFIVHKINKALIRHYNKLSVAKPT
ncbi:MAG: quinone-dependent dihydroorotate dehydrogenase [Bacteroidales bacterium]|nr:quinone-dependent dihydroorotate dehydrogenase [Bacteroidales bacterium]